MTKLTNKNLGRPKCSDEIDSPEIDSPEIESPKVESDQTNSPHPIKYAHPAFFALRHF